jgi:hypothetical protein
MNTDFFSILGLAGMIIIVIAYYANQTQKIRSDDLAYSITNLVGAVLLLISLCVHFNAGSFMIEVFWIIISCIGIYRWKSKKIDQYPVEP